VGEEEEEEEKKEEKEEETKLKKNVFALKVLKRVRAKLEGRDNERGEQVGIKEQVGINIISLLLLLSTFEMFNVLGSFVLFLSFLLRPWVVLFVSFLLLFFLLDMIIEEAKDVDNLSSMFQGWCSWI